MLGCRKGNRDCVYPEPSSASKSKRRDSKVSKSSSHGESASSGDDEEINAKDESGDVLETIVDSEEPEEPSSATSAPPPKDESRTDSSTPSLTHGKSPTPSTEGSASTSIARDPTLGAIAAQNRLAGSIGQSRKWAELPRDLLFYLNYHRTHVTDYHYAFKYDQDDFLKTTFLEIAVRSEPLLYAVVGFSAYLYSVAKGDGKINDFLGYYNKSVTTLRISLTNNQKPTVATLLTILQLATIEV